MGEAFIPLAVPDLSGLERDYLNKCIDTTYVSSVGEFVTRLEDMGASLSGARYGVATSSGTTGLHLALMCAGVKPGDIVIIPSFTFIASANAIAHCGAIPWVMDIDPATWCIDAEQVERELEIETHRTESKTEVNRVVSDSQIGTGRVDYEGEAEAELSNQQVLIHRKTGRRVAAIMPVYTLGCFPDMDKLRYISNRYGLPLVADAACAIGAKYAGKKIGKLADISVFSFNGNKTVTAGGGGLVIGDDERFMKLAKHISTTARISAEYDFDMVGYNYRMTNIQAAVGCAQLERLDELVASKKKVRNYYRDHLCDVPGISLFPDPKGQDHSCWLSGIVLDDKYDAESSATYSDLSATYQETVRDICSKLKALDIEARSFWKPVHLQAPYKECIKAKTLAITEHIWHRIVTLPCSSGITEEELQRVVSAVRKVTKT